MAKDEDDTTTIDWVDEPDNRLLTYYVTIGVTVDGYDKHTNSLLTALDESTAYEYAASLEAHNELVEDDGGWLDEYMRYVPAGIKEIDAADVTVLSKYMHLWQYDAYIKEKLESNDE